MKKIDKLWFLFSGLVGLIIGQLTTALVIHPDILLEEGVVLAANAYMYGCVEAHGSLCLHKAILYRQKLEKIRLYEPRGR